MSWELLPIDIRVEILSLRYNIRNNAALIIQKYLDEKAINRALSLEIDINDCVLVMRPSTALIMEYCSKVVSGKNNFEFWTIILEQVNLGLIEDYDWAQELLSQNDTRYQYYIRIENACNHLQDKLIYKNI